MNRKLRFMGTSSYRFFISHFEPAYLKVGIWCALHFCNMNLVVKVQCLLTFLLLTNCGKASEHACSCDTTLPSCRQVYNAVRFYKKKFKQSQTFKHCSKCFIVFYFCLIQLCQDDDMLSNDIFEWVLEEYEYCKLQFYNFHKPDYPGSLDYCMDSIRGIMAKIVRNTGKTGIRRNSPKIYYWFVVFYNSLMNCNKEMFAVGINTCWSQRMIKLYYQVKSKEPIPDFDPETDGIFVKTCKKLKFRHYVRLCF